MRGQGRRRRASCWSYTAGAKGHAVTVYERTPGGPLQARCFDATLYNGRGGYRREALGHRDRAKAEAYAHEQAAKLLEGRAELVPGTLARLFAAYSTYRTSHKTVREQSEDERRVTLWTRVLGARKDPHKITRGEWERFADARRCGAIDGCGEPVEEKHRKPVRAGTVRADCLWLRQVLGWGTTWREGDGNGPYLVRENPVRGFAVPDEKNPRRAVATTDRYEAIAAKAGQVHPFLPVLLALVHGTGRRVSAVLALRYRDLQPARTKGAPHGAIAWPGETDKMGKAWSAPVNAAVRAALESFLAERPGLGGAYLFPSHGNPAVPVRYDVARRWLVAAERLAKVPKQDGSLWHAYRRGWATARKHLPIGDVAQAGGWESTETLQRCYQQPDPATILAVVLGGAELREAQA